MLPRRLRLSRAGFESARGLKRAASPHFSLSYGAADPGGVAIVVSKKAARLAVTRHLIRRRLYSLLRPYADPSRALIVHVRAGANTLSFSELKDELTALLNAILPTESKH